MGFRFSPLLARVRSVFPRPGIISAVPIHHRGPRSSPGSPETDQASDQRERWASVPSLPPSPVTCYRRHTTAAFWLLNRARQLELSRLYLFYVCVCVLGVASGSVFRVTCWILILSTSVEASSRPEGRNKPEHNVACSSCICRGDVCVCIKARVEHGRQRAGRGGCSSLCLGPWSKALHALKRSGCSISFSSCPGTFHILVFNIYMWVITMLLPAHNYPLLIMTEDFTEWRQDD